MKPNKLADLTVPQLVDRFATIGIEQNSALLYDEFAKFSRLYREMDAINNELKSRHGDQRSALTVLFNHPDVQVRLKAALCTMEIVPHAAREVFQRIVDARLYPQAADALAAIWRLEGRPLVRSE